MNKKRWLSMYVENQIGVLSKISGLLSGKNYNIDSIAAGVTEDETITRITIGLTCDDLTYEQILKQLNRCIETIRVWDITNQNVFNREICFIRIKNLTKNDREEVMRIKDTHDLRILSYQIKNILLESVKSEDENNELISFLKQEFTDRVEIVRSGPVAIEK